MRAVTYKNYYSEQSGAKYFLSSDQKLTPKQLTFEDVPMNFYSMYDVLGWFMTVIGPAPQKANRENYLVPMGSVFSQSEINPP